ncbi:MAG: glycosyltransferase [Eubacterium sp.]|nr:glycosyltransferase [Eubacterium sp.]MCM1215883.1 glycosyltransferase [Lachnospiraceae bacterium]MCM1239263.1 glycosyltransferase [Lachnospiraceae bacterium]
MEEKRFSYDWEAYYQTAYEKEKKKNTFLAARIADAQVKKEDLRANLERIETNIFWKMSAPFRKCYYALKAPASGRAASAGSEEYVREYQEEVFRQKHPYLQWIREKEAFGGGQEIRSENRVEGWRKIGLKNSELCVIVCGNGVVDERAEETIRSWFDRNKSCIFAYADEDYYWKDLSYRMHPRFKPCWSPDTMLSFCYAGHMIIVNKSLYHGLLEGKNYDTGSYADFYELCFRLEERVYTLEECDRLAQTLQDGATALPYRIGNIEHVLFHNCYEPDAAERRRIGEAEQSGADVLEVVEELLQEKLEQGYDMEGCGAAYGSVREAALKRRNVRAHLEPGMEEDVYHVCYDVSKRAGGPSEMVSVIIPSKDHPELLERCLSSFREKTEYTNYEWIVVDNGSAAENKARIDDLQKEYGFRYLYQPMEFNFSAMCDLGVRNAKAEYVLLLNDDIEIIQKDWLRIMLGQAMQPRTGAVGARLWYADGRIQHAGITNMGIGPSHKLASLLDDRCYYYGRNQVTYDMAGVTAACLLIEKKKYLEAGGLDETMKVAYNDVDFCFRLLEKGYYNVLRNDAVLYHYESMSRGLDQEDEDKWIRLLEEKEALYAKHPEMRGQDPFYSRNLNDDNIRYTCNFKYDYGKKDRVSEVMPSDAGILRKTRTDVMHLVLDQAGEQRKGRPDEPDIMAVTGWSYIPGEDNARYARKILLQKEDGTLYQAELFPWYRKDVEKVLTNEVHILLAGFVSRFVRDELPAGQWKVGMLAEDRESRRKYVAWSDQALTIGA